MPQVSAEHRKLESLAGSWAGEETLFPSPWDAKGGTAMGRITARIDLDGFFLVTDYVEERGGKVSYRGHGVYGWDKGSYTMHWFDSMGSPCNAPAKGTWEGNVLTFQSESPMGKARYIYTFEDKDRHTFRIENSQDGKTWMPFMEGRYKRV
ncbi:MAG: DUF1579 family protein [Acidobacteriota bacterium]